MSWGHWSSSFSIRGCEPGRSDPGCSAFSVELAAELVGLARESILALRTPAPNVAARFNSDPGFVVRGRFTVTNEMIFVST